MAMARAALTLCFLTLLAFIVVCSGTQNSKSEVAGKRSLQTKLWCVANRGAPTWRLLRAANAFCNKPEAHCELVNRGGACYEPNNVFNHASVLFNQYYKAHGGRVGFCPADVAVLTYTDPSYGNCKFP